MCGIIGAFDLKGRSSELRAQVLKMSKKIRHRGPDWSGIFSDTNAIISHERLAIVDPKSGNQPLYSPDRKLILAANGEIYNHQELRQQFPDYEFQTETDSEILLALYQEKGPNFLDELNGIFAFAIYDVENDAYFIARDHIGIIPLYIGWDDQDAFFVASELKALEGICSRIETFKPGHYIYSKDGQHFQQWYKRDWESFENIKDNESDIDLLRKGLEAAVHRQLMSDVPYGVLLSGRLDSSVIAAVTKLFASKRIESNDQENAWYPQLHSFAVGLKGSPDLIAAKKAADHIGTVHHEINFS